MMKAKKVKVVVNKESKAEMRLNLETNELTIFARDKDEAKRALSNATASGWIDNERADNQREDLDRFFKTIEV